MIGDPSTSTLHFLLDCPGLVVWTTLYAQVTMPGEPAKRTRREEYKKSLQADEQNAALPKKKFYRQRAHANPFSDHSLS